MSRTVGLAASLVLAGLVGCQTAPDQGPATLEVNVMQGFARPTVPLSESVVPVTVIVDARTAQGPERAAAFVAALPVTTELQAVAIGLRPSAEECAVGQTVSGRTTEQVATRLRGMRNGEGGSLAATLRSFSGEGARPAGRVVVFSSFQAEPSCEDLCEAASDLVQGETFVDWVVVGEGDAPSCLGELLPQLAGSGPVAASLEPAPPTFQVRAGADPAGDGLAAGRAGDTVSVVPGAVTVWLDLEPPEAVGPMALEAGQKRRLFVLDFPMADPPLRSWWTEEGEVTP